MNGHNIEEQNMLFEPLKLGRLELKNRFVRSATFEGMADADGAVTAELIDFYKTLSKGEIGTIITGFMYVNKEGKGAPHKTSISKDEDIPGLRRLAETIKAEESRTIFQIGHSGGQTRKQISGHTPLAPSNHLRDPVLMSKPRSLSIDGINQVIKDFAEAGRRVQEAGADGIQLHAAHGYLLSEFLSPFFNKRTDKYGGSKENRYRLINEIISAIRNIVGDKFIISIKINHNDGTPQQGMTADLAAYYSSRLKNDGIDIVELSAGSTTWAPFNMSRGNVEVEEFTKIFPWLIRPIMRRRFKAMEGRVPFREAYNADSAIRVKEALGDVPLILVGGLRTLNTMEKVSLSGKADLISMSRPLIRQPNLIKLFESRKAESALCDSCNRCLVAIYKGLPLGCYNKGLP